jgi:hypothetical protein
MNCDVESTPPETLTLFVLVALALLARIVTSISSSE